MCGIFGYLLAQRGNVNNISWRLLWNSLKKQHGRGPESTKLLRVSDHAIFGFNRLRINDVSTAGDQPMRKGNISVIANAEIYNYEALKAKYGFQFETTCDVEILLHLYEKYGSVDKFIDELDGVFAFIIHDSATGETTVARDPIGVRPIHMGQDTLGNWAFASEIKSLMEVVRPDSITAFKPGTLWRSKDEQFVKWYNPTHNWEETNIEKYDEAPVLQKTGELLEASVRKRMMSDRPIGTFLSGGLDSSVVAALIKKYHRDSGINSNLNTFSIGLRDSPDLFYANMVAKHINSTHHHVEVHKDDCLNILEDVIYTIETFDTTTIRASTPMYLLSKYIRENSDDVVIYSGEGSDEITQGYLYFKNAPSPLEGAQDAWRLVQQLYEYDVLRVDRTTAAHGLEVREPFLDKSFMQHYWNLPTNIKNPRNGIEKFHLRKAIDVTFPGLLPKEIIWRQKEAFSDGVSSLKEKTWIDEIKDFANATISDKEFEEESRLYTPTPQLKDQLLFRRIFNKYYGSTPTRIEKYWVPQWVGDNKDSSARAYKALHNTEKEAEVFS